MRSERWEEHAKRKFEVASCRLRKKSHLHSVKVQGKAASAGAEGAASYLCLANVISDGSSSKQKIFNVDELYQKKMSSRATIAAEKSQSPIS